MQALNASAVDQETHPAQVREQQESRLGPRRAGRRFLAHPVAAYRPPACRPNSPWNTSIQGSRRHMGDRADVAGMGRRPRQLREPGRSPPIRAVLRSDRVKML